MQDFNGKVVVITGGATGIGFALAKQFAQQGARLVIAGIQKNRLEEAAKALSSIAEQVEITECDVTDRAQVEALAGFAWEKYGRVDVIVNNAGVGPIPSTVIDSRPEDVQSVLAVNLFGVWNGVSIFGRRFIEQGTPAAIYNVGSENSFFNAIPEGAGYVLSKHAVLAMTVALREELPKHIDVALICPGLVLSELAKETQEGMDTDTYAALVMKQIKAGEFYIVSHAFNMVRIKARWNEIEAAFSKYAPRYEGDVEFDVRTLGAKNNWYPRYPNASADIPV
ncbi:SDR family oxidoreductase [Burkholderia sp. Ac-20365]|jgi:NAD(P)-dependent dehydrogenase (short-subunit alcohol dehydrogenase family)|uniref:SDR family NAD(P)-dependent oxidoreductase n=1 Tax=Burkholderia sp. Ac-20365 TaxID=2703897 RepID=UPI00197BA3D2|nr:SDR family oxidoreductase [Burkholderia sp. Ac-20365]MBN3761627.1 SDR family oxidoreductase [Burkholderia sp. Ac-20365]